MAHQTRVKKTFCTTREAAQILGVSLRTAQLWTESGLLEAWKTEGGHRRISRTSVERLLANPKGKARSDAGLEKPGSGGRDRFLILVVEDEPDLRRVYELTLARWPMHPRVIAVADGYEALVRIGLEKPDLVISDLRMPGMDGFQMIRSLRDMPEMAGMTIVVVSGLDPNEVEEGGGLPAGIPLLPKPIPFEELREIAEQAAARSGKTA